MWLESKRASHGGHFTSWVNWLNEIMMMMMMMRIVIIFVFDSDSDSDSDCYYCCSCWWKHWWWFVIVIVTAAAAVYGNIWWRKSWYDNDGKRKSKAIGMAKHKCFTSIAITSLTSSTELHIFSMFEWTVSLSIWLQNHKVE